MANVYRVALCAELAGYVRYVPWETLRWMVQSKLGRNRKISREITMLSLLYR